MKSSRASGLRTPKGFEQIRRAWRATAKRFGGVHPHRAQEVIVQAADEESRAGRAPRYLLELRDLLIQKFPPRKVSK